MNNISSRERLLTTLDHRKPDYIPCCFSAYSGLAQRCASRKDFVLRQLEMGLDAAVTNEDLPISFHPSVEYIEWKEERSATGEAMRYPMLHGEYRTPAGSLTRSVKQTEDWPDGDHIPFLSDHVIPRATKHLVNSEADLEPLRYLLQSPTDGEIEAYRASAAAGKQLAGDHGLALSTGWLQHADFACWLTGIQDLILLALDAPEFIRSYLGIIEEWNRARMEIVLGTGVDIVIRRGWYENADFWPPDLYREFMLPALKRDVEQVHAASARLGYIMSCSSMPLIEMLVEAGVDILLGVDPAQDRMMDLAKLKEMTRGKMALWGGVCGYLTVECGTQDEIRREVRDAMSILAPGGGFILAPVTNVRADTARARENVEAMISEWKRLR